jgi:hypothetical protein
MADADIPARDRSSKNLRLVSSPFEQTAIALGYDITPAVSPISTRIYADLQTQTAFDIWNAGAAYVACMVTESTLETEALCDKLKALACAK